MYSARTPEQVNECFTAAFNARDLPGLLSLYETDALLVPQPEAPAVAGTAAIENALAQLLGLGGTMAFERVFCLTSGDLALMSVRFRIHGMSGAGGTPVEMEGATSELARRQPDGTWRYVIDHPFGAAPAAATDIAEAAATATSRA